MFCGCFVFLLHFSDFCQTNYLNICLTDLNEICRIGRKMNDLKLFFDPSRDVAVLWAKSTSIANLVVRMTFTRAAPPAYDKKGSCYAGRRQTNYLTRRT